RARGPGLVAVDDPAAAAALRARRDPRGVGSRVALGDAARLEAERARRYRRQPAALLLVGPAPEQRAHRVHLRVARARASARGVDLLEDDGRLLEPEAAAAIFGRGDAAEHATT